jgi:Uma2 family endonuclease
MTAMPPKYVPRDPLSTIPTNLPSEDGENIESAWHRDQMNLLIESLRVRWRGRTDYYCGGNMFIHFSPKHVRNQDFRGPDFFVVLDVDGTREREYWAVWEEEGRYPDVIVELLSPTTAKADRTTKKAVYERTFKTMNYFLYDRETGVLEGHRLDENFRYQPIKPENNRLWCEALGCWFGPWEGPFQCERNTWIRMFEPNGEMIPLFSELAEAEKHFAESEKHRAEAAEAEVARLKAELERLKNSTP